MKGQMLIRAYHEDHKHVHSIGKAGSSLEKNLVIYFSTASLLVKAAGSHPALGWISGIDCGVRP